MRGHVIVGVMTISTDVDKLYDTKVASSCTTCCAKTAGSLQIVKRRQRAFKITGRCFGTRLI